MSLQDQTISVLLAFPAQAWLLKFRLSPQNVEKSFAALPQGVAKLLSRKSATHCRVGGYLISIPDAEHCQVVNLATGKIAASIHIEGMDAATCYRRAPHLSLQMPYRVQAHNVR